MQIREIDAARIRETVRDLCMIANTELGGDVVNAYEDLGPEAIRELTVENFSVTVANDAFGGDIFRQGQTKYAQQE